MQSYEEREVTKMPESVWADGRLVVRRPEATDDVLGKLFSVRTLEESDLLGRIAVDYGQQVLDGYAQRNIDQ
jgi:hypothetical protein